MTEGVTKAVRHAVAEHAHVHELNTWFCAASEASDSELERTGEKIAAASSPAAASGKTTETADGGTVHVNDAANPPQPAAKRDDWMSEANARPLFSADVAEAEETPEQKQAARAERMKVRPVNSHGAFQMFVHHRFEPCRLQHMQSPSSFTWWS